MDSSNAHLHWDAEVQHPIFSSYWMVARDDQEWHEILKVKEQEAHPSTGFLNSSLAATNSINLPTDDLGVKIFSLGIHPWFILTHDQKPPLLNREAHIRELEQHLQKHPNLHIGEIGLDALHGPSLDIQVEYFEAQLELAQKYKRKVAVHLVKAFESLRRSLERFPDVKGLIHGYSGSVEWMLQMEGLGWCFSFGPEILNPTRRRSREAFLASDSYLLESDELQMDEATWEEFSSQAAELKGLDYFEFLELTNKRFADIFRMEPP